MPHHRRHQPPRSAASSSRPPASTQRPPRRQPPRHLWSTATITPPRSSSPLHSRRRRPRVFPVPNITEAPHHQPHCPRSPLLRPPLIDAHRQSPQSPTTFPGPASPPITTSTKDTPNDQYQCREMPYMNVLPNCPSMENIQIANPICNRVAPVLAEDNQSEASKLLDGADSSSFSEHCADKPRKRRRLNLLDADKEEDAEGKTEDFNHRSLDNGRPPKKQKCVEDGKHVDQLDILTPVYSELALPFKKRRVYRVVNEDKEVMVGTGDDRCAESDVSKSVVAKDHLLQSRRPFDSESTDQQCCMDTVPFDEVAWSGTLKINSEVSVRMAAHLSSKTCERVWELSKSLRKLELIEVIKLPRLEAWPKSWETSGPTDDDIALYFFPFPSMSPTKELELDDLVKEIIESNSILKSDVGTAELLPLHRIAGRISSSPGEELPVGSVQAQER